MDTHNLFNMIIFTETSKANMEFQVLIYAAVLGRIIDCYFNAIYDD